jgi:hypothetical protein
MYFYKTESRPLLLRRLLEVVPNSVWTNGITKPGIAMAFLIADENFDNIIKIHVNEKEEVVEFTIPTSVDPAWLEKILSDHFAMAIQDSDPEESLSNMEKRIYNRTFVNLVNQISCKAIQDYDHPDTNDEVHLLSSSKFQERVEKQLRKEKALSPRALLKWVADERNGITIEKIFDDEEWIDPANDFCCSGDGPLLVMMARGIADQFLKEKGKKVLPYGYMTPFHEEILSHHGKHWSVSSEYTDPRVMMTEVSYFRLKEFFDEVTESIQQLRAIRFVRKEENSLAVPLGTYAVHDDGTIGVGHQTPIEYTGIVASMIAQYKCEVLLIKKDESIIEI